MIQTIVLAALFSASAFAQPIEATLYSVDIRVEDFSSAERLYSGLGFTVSGSRSPEGRMEGMVVRFGGPACCLEFFEPRDKTQKIGPSNVELEIASAEQAAHDLNAAGVKMNAPVSGSRIVHSPTGPATLKWQTLRFTEQLGSRPVYFMQSLTEADVIAARDKNIPVHANQAGSLAAAVIAVNDLEQAAAGYAHIGTPGARDIELPEFGAIAREIAFQSGSIFLLRATDPSGPAARRLKAQGEGILAVRIAVNDLAQTRKLIGEKNVSKSKQSVLVAPENAAGVWLQFQSAHP
jgi:Glyoxalase-like domain